MIEMELSGYETKATMADVEAIEQKMGIKLPKEYVEIVLKYNDGYPLKYLYPFDDTEKYNHGYPVKYIYPTYTVGMTHSSCSDFISISLNDEWNILNAAEKLQRDNIIPEKVIPFGQNGGGNYVCFDYRGRTKHPRIVHHSYETADDIHEGIDNLYYVAITFKQFLKTLTEYHEDLYII